MLLALAGALACLSPSAHDPHAKDLQALQGEWLMAALEINGEHIAAARLEGTVLTIKGNRYIVKVKDRLTAEAIIELDASKDPKELNMTPQDGGNKDKLQKAIYKIAGDTFTMARGLNPEQERPRHFATLPGTNTFVVTWKRRTP
ncbi:MAG: TIGR03067 domain-containing protein [Gemmataceae bacterium]|nr:TIGR03067 domain-containing protein [Gemmataceae bacterium]